MRSRVPARRNFDPDLAPLLSEHKYLLKNWVLGVRGAKGVVSLWVWDPGPFPLTPTARLGPRGKSRHGQVCPIFRGTLFPDSLMSQVHLYAQVCLGISGGRVLGRWLQAEAMGA